jgi:hypothetical protein
MQTKSLATTKLIDSSGSCAKEEGLLSGDQWTLRIVITIFEKSELDLNILGLI